VTPQPIIDEIKNRIVLSDLIGRRVPLKRAGREFIGLSPFSSEKTPSFTVNDEKQFYHCFSSGKNGDAFEWLKEMENLSFAQAVEQLASETGVTVTIPAKPRTEKTGAKKLVAEYIYRDQNGDPYHRVQRYEYEGGGKTFSQSHWNTIDEIWIDRAGPNPPIPYNLPEIIARPNEPIWLVEGEKNADDLISRGLVATTARGGSSAFPKTNDFAVWFDGSTVYALPDNDEPGERWLERVRQLIPHAITVTIPGLPHKGDVSDWLASGGTVEQLQAMAVASSSSPAPVSTRITPTPFEWVDSQAIKPRAWLYGNHLIRRFVSLTVSPGGIGKSSLVLMDALCMTSGRALLVDDKPRTSEPLRVWYWNGEDPQDETQRRVIAAAMHHKLTPDDVGGRLFTDTGREQTITLGQIVRGEISLQEDLFEELEREILARNIDVFILDPFVSAHRMGENDNNAIDAVVKRLGKLSERCNCAVEIVHHVRKPGGGSKDQTDVNDARGASALVGGVRSARVLNVMSEEIAAEIDGISPEDRFSYFTVTNGKSNMTKRSGEGQWRRLVDVDLLNGPVGVSDHVGVVEHYKLPKKAAVLDALPPNAVMIAQKTAYDNPMQTRLDVQSHDWFGHALGRALAINSVDKSGQETLKTAISIWVKSGALSVEIRPDAQRRPRQYLTCPASETPLQPTFDPEDDSPF
jgi:hypothetical protein